MRLSCGIEREAARRQPMATPELDKFGRVLVTSLRDAALDFYDGLTCGHWKSPAAQQLQLDLAKLSPEQVEVVRRCVVACVDSGIHDFLFALSEAHDFGTGITVVVDGKNIAELSDGLQGEPYGVKGWVAKFSKHSPGSRTAGSSAPDDKPGE
jgi:hypothetical protein